MNHAITVGGLLGALGIVAGVIAILAGALFFFAGMMSDAQEDGTSAGTIGCVTIVGGIVVIGLSLCALF